METPKNHPLIENYIFDPLLRFDQSLNLHTTLVLLPHCTDPYPLRVHVAVSNTCIAITVRSNSS
jgi:hypothetical protein